MVAVATRPGRHVHPLWEACAVRQGIGGGLQPGGFLQEQLSRETEPAHLELAGLSLC